MSAPAKVSLTLGYHAIVDEEDLSMILSRRWRAQRSAHGHVYAVSDSGRVGPRMLMHRMILAAPKGWVVDHVNGDTLDNTRSNIRVCSPRENAFNVTSSPNQKTGGFKGICWKERRGKWIARVPMGPHIAGKNRPQKYLGALTDPSDAARLYDVWAMREFGEFASTNFPKSDYTEDRIADVLAKAAASPNQQRGAYRGVTLRKSDGMWEAFVQLPGTPRRRAYGGLFASAVDAAKARDSLALELLGCHVRLNFPASGAAK